MQISGEEHSSLKEQWVRRLLGGRETRLVEGTKRDVDGEERGAKREGHQERGDTRREGDTRRGGHQERGDTRRGEHQERGMAKSRAWTAKEV